MCPANDCIDDYVGEAGRRITERIMDHNGRNVNFNSLKHHLEKEHQCLQNKNFVILSGGF